ncbi:unnamed protein product, partial [Adineta ricciae]
MENIIKMFVSGSSAEGQSYANHFRHDNQLQDFDFMLEVCALNSNDQLVLINNAPGFVLVKWSSENVTKDLPHNSQFVDGFRMKQQFADHYISSVNASPLLASQFNTTTGTASIEATIQSDLIHQATKFHNALKYVETLQSDENKKKKFIEYHEWCEDNISNIFDKCLPELPMYDYFGKNYVSDCFCMVSPAFGFQLSAEHRKRAESVLNFYLKYRHSYCISQQIYKYLQKSSCLDTRPVDADLVPAIRLDFWPSNMNWFLNRLKTNRPLLFEKIEPLHMHIIPKWSGRTEKSNENIEFRYSFTAIEKELADQ